MGSKYIALDNLLTSYYDAVKLTEAHIEIRNEVKEELRTEIVKIFPDVRLKFFGSSANGFGARTSDLDICILKDNRPSTFYPSKISKSELDELDKKCDQKMLQRIEERLRNSLSFECTGSVLLARVPIVKFWHRESKLEGDLCLNNSLAIQNTALLRAYSEIDERVKILCCFLKRVMKSCDLADASKKSLSSLAYCMMMIHFLQQIKIPVLPVLQQLPHDAVFIEGFECGFYKGIENLPKIWPMYKKNEQTVGELWMDFLDYFAEQFDFDKYAITIQQIELLERSSSECLLRGISCIAIENIFDTTINLGRPLSGEMSQHIISTFGYLKQAFTSYFDNCPTWMALFRRNQLLHFVPCPRCSGLGHVANKCPSVNDPTTFF